MITIRGQSITVCPLTLTEVGQVLDSVQALGTCTPTIRVFSREMYPHLLRVIAVIVRRQIRDASIEEIDEALDITNITAVLRALSSGKYPTYIHQEIGHG